MHLFVDDVADGLLLLLEKRRLIKQTKTHMPINEYFKKGSSKTNGIA